MAWSSSTLPDPLLNCSSTSSMAGSIRASATTDGGSGATRAGGCAATARRSLPRPLLRCCSRRRCSGRSRAVESRRGRLVAEPARHPPSLATPTGSAPTQRRDCSCGLAGRACRCSWPCSRPRERRDRRGLGATAGYLGGRVTLDDAVRRRALRVPYMFFVIILTVVFGRSLWLIFLAIARRLAHMARIVRDSAGAAPARVRRRGEALACRRAASYSATSATCSAPWSCTPR